MVVIECKLKQFQGINYCRMIKNDGRGNSPMLPPTSKGEILITNNLNSKLAIQCFIKDTFKQLHLLK